MQDVIDSMPDSLVVLDANGVVELCNRTFAQRMNYESPAEVVGQGLEGLVGEARPGWYTAVVDTGELVAQDVRFRTQQGTSITLKTSGQVRGDGTGVVLVARDNLEVSRLTSELQRTAERLEDSERFFQDLFDAMEDPITVLSPQYEILQANREARLVFGKDLIGRRCYRAFRMREEPCADCPARETFLLHHSTSVEHRIFGNAITRISTYPLLGKDGQLHAVINHKRDVTKERQLEDLKASFSRRREPRASHAADLVDGLQQAEPPAPRAPRATAPRRGSGGGPARRCRRCFRIWRSCRRRANASGASSTMFSTCRSSRPASCV
jgi:PAS domain-containing protein